MNYPNILDIIENYLQNWNFSIHADHKKERPMLGEVKKALNFTHLYNVNFYDHIITGRMDQLHEQTGIPKRPQFNEICNIMKRGFEFDPDQFKKAFNVFVRQLLTYQLYSYSHQDFEDIRNKERQTHNAKTILNSGAIEMKTLSGNKTAIINDPDLLQMMREVFEKQKCRDKKRKRGSIMDYHTIYTYTLALFFCSRLITTQSKTDYLYFTALFLLLAGKPVKPLEHTMDIYREEAANILKKYLKYTTLCNNCKEYPCTF